MKIGINDLDDDDVVVVPPQPEPPHQDEPPVQNSDDDFLKEYLSTKGITDMNQIAFEDDNGLIINRSWNDLDKEEKFNILSSSLEQPQETNNNDLTDEEIGLINEIRKSQLTPSQYLQSFQQPAEPTYKVDTLSDDELYILDLEAKVGELTDEQAAQALSIAKQNEDLYSKQIAGLRKEYKEREDYLGLQEQAQLEQQQLAEFQEFQGNVLNAIENFKTVGDLDLKFEDADKEELAQFMLSSDAQGNNYLYSALQDPKNLVKAAWFLLNGDEVINTIQEYFVNLIKLVSESQYNKGLEDAKKGITPKPNVVITQPKNNPRHYTTIDDLDDEA